MYILVLSFVSLLTFPLFSFAQLPTPTYGWNLGNTLEPPSGEGTWNNPPVTQELINAVAAAGFNAVRIPVALDSHANQATYAIDPDWLARVKEVVDYCYAANLHVLINCHWDNGWLENNIGNSVDSTINAKQYAYWTQVANVFINYDDRLLFAGCNEPNADTAAKMATLLVYEQTFVDAVRATGGSNSTRWLVVQGPNTDIDKTYELMNELPVDSTVGRLMVEVHYYTPWQFCGLTEDVSWGDMFYFWGQDYHSDTLPSRNCTWGEEDFADQRFQMMADKFVSQGIPVLLGEFGSTRRTSSSYSDLTGDDEDLHLASRTYFNKYILDSATSRGIHCFYWDNGALDGGGLLNRYTNAVMDQDNVRALTGGPALAPPGSDITAPTAPTGLAVQLESVAVKLDWDDNSEDDLAGYNVYRSLSYDNGYTKLNSTDAAVSEYIDNTAVGGETYYYVITAFDTSQNESAGSNREPVVIPVTALGSILREVWIGISGTTINDLTSISDYPDTPFISEQITSLEGPTNWTNEYGTRIRGYLYPPATGDYTFWVAGDDNCELWLSSDGTPGNALLIANVPGWTNSGIWDKFPEQKSAVITLTAGNKYYIEVLHKEGTGGDNLAVAWSGPGITQQVIDGIYLSPWFTGSYGDFDNSGTVSVSDLAELSNLWLLNDCLLSSVFDLDGNCITNLYEISQLAENWLE